MLKVALTGGIATGKSYVLSRLQERGIDCIDADDVVHQNFGQGTAVTAAIASQFGPWALNADGSVNRAALGAKVFSDPDSRMRLESIIHPVVYQAINRWYDGLTAGIGVASIPLLYETGRERDFDVVVATLCDRQQQLARIIERDNLSKDEASRRLAAQMPAEEKAARANFVIHTGGTMTATDRQVDELLLALQDLTK